MQKVLAGQPLSNALNSGIFAGKPAAQAAMQKVLAGQLLSSSDINTLRQIMRNNPALAGVIAAALQQDQQQKQLLAALGNLGGGGGSSFPAVLPYGECDGSGCPVVFPDEPCVPADIGDDPDTDPDDEPVDGGGHYW
jgi:hypothetical protein